MLGILNFINIVVFYKIYVYPRSHFISIKRSCVAPSYKRLLCLGTAFFFLFSFFAPFKTMLSSVWATVSASDFSTKFSSHSYLSAVSMDCYYCQRLSETIDFYTGFSLIHIF